MNPTEMEELRRRLEEQLRADIELLQEAHRVKLRAFETLLREGRPAPVAPESPSGAPRRKAWSVLDAIESALGQLPEVFDKDDLHRAIGQIPSRATLFRALEMLAGEGKIRLEQEAAGRQPARFRKLV